MNERAHTGGMDLRRIETPVLDRLGRWIYCHHCHELTEMAIWGRDSWDQVVYHCPCGGIVHVQVARADYRDGKGARWVKQR